LLPAQLHMLPRVSSWGSSMFSLIKKVIHDCLTGVDGVTYDPARVYGGMAILVFLGNSMYAIYLGQPWGAIDFGTGFGMVIAGFGTAVFMKSGTEPTGEDPGK
jgi:hypothetical protein